MNHAEFEPLLAGAFAPLAPSRLNGANGRWKLPAPLGDGAGAGIAVDGRWAIVQCPAPDAGGRPWLDALAAQARWPGGVKCIGSQRRSLLRAEIPLLTTTAAGREWVVQQLRASCAGLLSATGAAGQAPWFAVEQGSGPDPEWLGAVCEAGGWDITGKPDGSVQVDLQLRGAHRTLELRACGAAIRASVTLAAGTGAGADSDCRSAAAQLLMRATAALRWARAFANCEEGRLAGLGFECLVAAPPHEQALLLAVDALIAASELFGREAEVLLECPEVASRYLQLGRDAVQAADENAFFNPPAAPFAAPFPHAARAALV